MGSGIALVLYNSFWVVHVIVGVVLNVCFGKQLTHIVYLDTLIIKWKKVSSMHVWFGNGFQCIISYGF